jgi:Flp pilus assembly protein TadG
MSKRSSWLKRLMSPAVRRARAFGRDDNGVTAIEFGILALPFFTLVTAIVETAVIFLAGQILDSAVNDSSRLIRTGQAQTGTPAFNAAAYRDAICAGLYGMFDCDLADDKLRVSVTVISDFGAAAIGYPLETGEDCEDNQCDWTLADDYTPGKGNDVVLVQAYYKWPTVVNLPGFNLQTLPDGTRLLGASRVFRNEPFVCAGCP